MASYDLRKYVKVTNDKIAIKDSNRYTSVFNIYTINS